MENQIDGDMRLSIPEGNLQCSALAGFLFALGLASPHPRPYLPLVPLFGACPLLISSGLQGKEKWLGG
jgi:hypothetical protein